jgi:hypothetical protein
MCSSKCSQKLFDLSHILRPKLYSYNLNKQPKIDVSQGQSRETTVAIFINNSYTSPSPKYPSKPPAIKIFIDIKFQKLREKKNL